MEWLIEEKFQNSQYFKRLKPATYRLYELTIPSIKKEFGDMPLSVLKDRRTRGLIVEWRDSIAEGTCETMVSKRPDYHRAASDSMADLHVVKFSAILKWGSRMAGPRLIPAQASNPCIKVRGLTGSGRGNRKPSSSEVTLN
jgi:hypothetical protein